MYTSYPLGFLTWQICVCLSVCGIVDVISGSALCSSLMDNLVSGASLGLIQPVPFVLPHT